MDPQDVTRTGHRWQSRSPALRFYRALLRMVPASDREALGDDMEAVVVSNLAERRRRHGRLGVAIAMGRAALDVLAFAISARTDDEGGVADLWPTLKERRMRNFARFIRSVGQDLRFAIRLLRKEPAFAATTLLTLTVCIAANVAIFSIVRSVVLKPLSIPNADSIVMFHNNYPNAGLPRGGTSVPDYFDRQAQTDTFAAFALYRRQGATLGAPEGAERIMTVRATPSFYGLLSARPLLGRAFQEAEGEPGRDRVVLLSYARWQQTFGGATDVVGQAIQLNGQSFQIVGVLPHDFTYLWNDVDVYAPAAFTARDKSDDARHSDNWDMIAVLKPGMSLTRAQQEVDAVNRHNDDRFPQFRQLLADAHFYTSVVPLQDELVHGVRTVLFLLWGGVLLLLLIGGLNVANLVLVRSTARTREMATRGALGADATRLARQILTETVLVAATGGVLGLALGRWALRLIPLLGVNTLPRGREIGLDLTGGLLTLVVALTVGILVGVLPVVRLRHISPTDALREDGRFGTASRGTSVLRRGLATAQVSLAFVLLIGAGLFLASFRAALHIDPGFAPAGVITAAITLPAAQYKDEMLAPFVRSLLTRVRAIPGITAAGITSMVPMSGNHNSSVVLAEGHRVSPGESLVSPEIVTVSDGYFDAIRTPLERGRYLNDGDVRGSQPVVVIDERLANHFWPGQDPVGRRLYEPNTPDEVFKAKPDSTFFTVVGVVREVQFDGLATAATPVGACYFSYAQAPERGLALTVRSPQPPDALVPSIRRAVAGLDKALPVFSVRTMDQYVDATLLPRRLLVQIASGFAGVALFLAAIGIYGVLSYGVVQRRRELGIRLALGGSAADVFRLVLREGATMVTVGLLVGIGALVALRHALANALYGVTPLDPRVIGVVALVLSLVALLATVVPASRAARTSPVVAIKD